MRFVVLALATLCALSPVLRADAPPRTAAWWWKAVHETDQGAQFSEERLPEPIQAIPLSLDRLARYRANAAQGDAEAQFILGVLYAEGNDSAETPNERATAQIAKGKALPLDYTQAALWYRKAADQGHAQAQNNLAVLYATGRGLSRDDAQAEAWCRRAAQQGYFRAQNNLGTLYELGHAVERNPSTAAAWYRLAADQGLAEAQFNLALLYDAGEGVDANAALARMWMGLAAAQRYEPAINALNDLDSRLNGVVLEEADILMREWKAAHQAPR